MARALPLSLPHRLGLLAYAGFWAAVGLLLGVAALQDYHQGGGTRDWEPFLWEFSSVLVVAPLALAVHAGVGRLRVRSGWRRWAPLAAGALLFNALHVVGMYGLRFAVYRAVGVPYEPDPWAEVLVYEGAKDAVSYALLAALSHAVWGLQTAAAQRQELERTRRELAEARLARLAEQVQPHFLFNSLNLIASVMHEDVDRADRLLCDLAELLRQTTAAQAAGEHTLADELALVRPFLALMQARFGERLQVQIEASEAALAVRLPALLLLAPVENAVKHDVARHGGPVTLRLQAEVRDGRVHLALDNSGVQAPGAPDGGHGLRNLDERLQARWGEAAHWHFGPHAGGMRLALSWPA